MAGGSVVCSTRKLRALTRSAALNATKANNRSAGCASPPCNAAVLGAPETPPICKSNRPYISFASGKTPITAVPTAEEGFWPLGPTVELLGLPGVVTSERTGGSAFMFKERPVVGVRFWRHSTEALMVIMYSLAVIVITRYLWPMLGSSIYCPDSPMTPRRTARTFWRHHQRGGRFSSEGRPAPELENGGQFGSVNVLADKSASKPYSDDALSHGLQYNSSSVRYWMHQASPPPPRRTNWMGSGRECSAVPLSMAAEDSS